MSLHITQEDSWGRNQRIQKLEVVGWESLGLIFTLAKFRTPHAGGHTWNEIWITNTGFQALVKSAYPGDDALVDLIRELVADRGSQMAVRVMRICLDILSEPEGELP